MRSTGSSLPIGAPACARRQCIKMGEGFFIQLTVRATTC